jgi:hypothetical protein
MREQGRGRFVVVISTPEKERVRELVGRNVDVRFVRSDEAGYHAEALSTLEEVGNLVEAGYTVLVIRTDRSKYKHKFIGFERWRKEIHSDLERMRKEA